MFILDDVDGTISDNFLKFNVIHKFGKKIIPDNEENNSVLEDIDGLHDVISKTKNAGLDYSLRYNNISQLKIPFYVHTNKKGKDVHLIQIQFEKNIADFLRQLYKIIDERGESCLFNSVFKIEMDNDYDINLTFKGEQKGNCRQYMESKYNNPDYLNTVLSNIETRTVDKPRESTELKSIVYNWMKNVEPFFIDKNKGKKSENRNQVVQSGNEKPIKTDGESKNNGYVNPFKTLFNDEDDEDDKPNFTEELLNEAKEDPFDE
jgi:hypothetical protein